MTDEEKAILAIVDYCKEWITDFQMRADLAVSKVWRERIPIERADYELANEVVEKIEEWQTEHDTDFDITEENIILNM